MTVIAVVGDEDRGVEAAMQLFGEEEEEEENDDEPLVVLLLRWRLAALLWAFQLRRLVRCVGLSAVLNFVAADDSEEED